MSTADRARFKELQLANFNAEGDLPDDEAAELAALTKRSYRIGVFQGDEVCGRRP